MQEFMELTGRRNFSEKYSKPLLNVGELDETSVGFSDKSSVEGTEKTVKIILWKHIKLMPCVQSHSAFRISLQFASF